MTSSSSVVIPTRERLDELERCLASIRAMRAQPDEVVVVDTSPHTPAATIASRWNARCVIADTAGASEARNRGAAEAAGELVAFIDDDAWADSLWLDRLLAPFDDPTVGATTGRILPDPDHPDQDKAARIAGADSRIPEPRIVSRRDHDWFELTNFGGIGDGANMAFRGSVFDGWGFDPRLGPGGTLIEGSEEHYGLFKVVEQGWSVAFVPESVVYHPFAPDGETARREVAERIGLSAAYTLFLLTEEPRYRRRTLGYALSASGGKPRPWRRHMEQPSRTLLPKHVLATAALRGATRYAGQLLRRNGRP